jgi:hypothetical protein
MRGFGLWSHRAVILTVVMIVLLPFVEHQSAVIAQQTTPRSTPIADSPSVATPATAVPMDLRSLGVNELGAVPVLMYHTFTTGEATDLWMRNLDDFRNDLLWLYEHNFYVISLRDLVDNTIDVPAGKHPVVLTFDDASANQFQFVLAENGELVPSPSSAVGVLESFFADYPDFGRGGHFAVTGYLCFANENDPAGVNTWDTHCPLKLQWLSDHGYEVGNHTWNHPSLSAVDGESVNNEVARTAAFINAHVDGPGNQASILTLPFGELPAEGSEGHAYLMDGVWWDGYQYEIDAITLVNGGPTHSPSSSRFDPYGILRFNTDSHTLAVWFGIMERGEIPLYTSDGDPATVVIPDPVPDSLQSQFDLALVSASGKHLVRYPIDAAEG